MKKHTEKPLFCLLAGDLAQDGKPEQLGQLRDLFQGLKLPIHSVPGNHDYQKQDDRKAFDELYPKSLNYHFEHGGWNFVGLDTTDGVKYNNTQIGKDTLQWIDDRLPKLDKKRPLIVFTHFPLGPKVTYRPENGEELLQRFKEHNLQAVFSGHYHAFTERQEGACTLTTNRCCAFSVNNHNSSKEKGYFLCRTKDGKVTREFVEVKV